MDGFLYRALAIANLQEEMHWHGMALHGKASASMLIAG